MDRGFFGQQGKKHRNTLCIPSIFDADWTEKKSAQVVYQEMLKQVLMAFFLLVLTKKA